MKWGETNKSKQSWKSCYFWLPTKLVDGTWCWLEKGESKSQGYSVFPVGEIYVYRERV